jgi:hypothetical protein
MGASYLVVLIVDRTFYKLRAGSQTGIMGFTEVGDPFVRSHFFQYGHSVDRLPCCCRLDLC